METRNQSLRTLLCNQMNADVNSSVCLGSTKKVVSLIIRAESCEVTLSRIRDSNATSKYHGSWNLNQFSFPEPSVSFGQLVGENHNFYNEYHRRREMRDSGPKSGPFLLYVQIVELTLAVKSNLSLSGATNEPLWSASPSSFLSEKLSTWVAVWLFMVSLRRCCWE